jgi:nucleotide sugar dehydrogenase
LVENALSAPPVREPDDEFCSSRRGLRGVELREARQAEAKLSGGERMGVVESSRAAPVGADSVPLADAPSAMVSKLRGRVASVAIIGCGYVGLPLAMASVESGFSVVGFDSDATKISRLRTSHSTVNDVSDDSLRAALHSGRLRFVSSADALGSPDVAVIAVPTPLRDGVPDLSAVVAASRTIGAQLRAGVLVVLESTTYPGTTDELVRPILEQASGLQAGVDFALGYAPERISPGDGRELRSVSRVVGGVDGPSTECAATFYEALVGEVYRARSCREAEMAKLIENTFRQVNIALVNELTTVAHTLGVDIWDALAAASTKPYGYMPFWPGPGVGGHCIAVDPTYLSWRVESQLGFGLGFVQQARAINNRMPSYVTERIQRLLNDASLPMRGAHIHVLGVGYKPGLGDIRESPAVAVVEHLIASGANVSYSDPHVRRIDVAGRTLRHQALDETLRDPAIDAVVLLAAEADTDVEWIARVVPRVFDAQGLTRASRPRGVTRL